MKPIVQISLDLTTIDEALSTAELALRAGVDWLEAGTPLILAEGLHGVRDALGKARISPPCGIIEASEIGSLGDQRL